MESENHLLRGASTYHSGIDIAAPTGTNFVAITNGKVLYTGFKGAGGYTLTIEHDNLQISYCHVSPTFIVNVGDYVSKGQIIRASRSI